MPPEDAYREIGTQLCSSTPAAGLALMADAFRAGGRNASLMLAALLAHKCANNASMPVSMNNFTQIPELYASTTAMK